MTTPRLEGCAEPYGGLCERCHPSGECYFFGETARAERGAYAAESRSVPSRLEQRHAQRGVSTKGAGPRVRMWLDDIRDPAMHGRIGWTWVKDYAAAIALLSTGSVVEASLDHDLTMTQTLGYSDMEKTGYDVLCWMEENNVWPAEGVHVHSLNPSGAQRMRQVIQRRAGGYREGDR